MTVIARDAVASDHLVYAWPFPLGPEVEVSCADDEQVVMCPAWLVGDRLGPGRHRWRTPDPMRPVAAFFVLTSPVEAAFDMTTSFLIPSTGQPVRLRATGALQVRCADPGLLIAQFVGLPFDHVNEGVLRSVARSVERMLARLLIRRVVMAGTALAVTDPAMMVHIVEELVAYNPTAGAVFGIELMRVSHLAIGADDGSSPTVQMPVQNLDWSGGVPRVRPAPPPVPVPAPTNGRAHAKTIEPPIGAGRGGDARALPIRPPGRDNPLLETVRGRPPADAPITPPAPPPGVPIARASEPDMQRPTAVSGEIGAPKKRITEPLAVASGEIQVRPSPEPASPPRAAAVEMPRSTDEITQPGVRTPTPGSLRLQTPVPRAASEPPDDEPRGSILGIGVAGIGTGAVSGEIPSKVAPGARVLVPGPNGLMQSATVRQLLQGYYELEVGSSGETIWVPINGVVPESA